MPKPALNAIVVALATVLAATTVAAPPPASAAPPGRTPYDVELESTLLITTASLSIIIGAEAVNRQRVHPDRSEWDADNVVSLDRWVVGNESPIAGELSDIILVTLAFGPYLIDGVDIAANGGDFVDDFGSDFLVMFEAQAINLAVNGLVKLATARPRPYMYEKGFVSKDPDDYRSFYSGHTAASFTAAVVWSRTWAERHDVGSAAAMWTGTLLLAAAAGYLRMASGRHYFTDVLAGAAIGTLIGYLVTEAHLPSDSDEDPLDGAPARRRGSVIGGAWTGTF